MAKRRKHRYHIDVTFSDPGVEYRKGAKGLALVLDRIDLNKAPVWAHDKSPYIDKLTVREARDRD